MSPLRLGVLGGTFDPIHYGHLRLAEEALFRFRLDRLLLIPTHVPPHKPGGPHTSAWDRLVMTLLAAGPHPCIEVCTIELDRAGPSYTVDTLRELRSRYSPDTRFYFILGADAALEMHTWKNPEQVLDLAHVVVTQRPGFDLERLRAVPVAGLPEKAELFPAPLIDLSSTEVRRRVAAGESIRYLTPEPVAEYIYNKKLYAASRHEPPASG